MFRTSLSLLVLLTTFAATPAFAQYNRAAGVSAPKAQAETVTRTTDDGRVVRETVTVPVQRDSYGNAGDSQFDLAVDGAFGGQTIVVVQLFQFDFGQARTALEKKGFSVYRFQGAPEPAKLKKALAKANQFWLVSDCSGQRLNESHAKVIKDFYDKGHGVYIWGDNDPCIHDANFISNYLFDVEMQGDTPGDQVITFHTPKSKSGIIRDHLLSTGIENIYEGITIATIQKNKVLTPLMWGSAGNLVAAFYDKHGKRAIVDGGFTRLYYKWDTAGTARYVTNAAAWLANVERFGDAVVAKDHRSETAKR